MPKVKTHKGASKRFHVTGSGKVLRRKGLLGHMRRKKSNASKRQVSSKLPVSPSFTSNIKRLLGKSR